MEWINLHTSILDSAEVIGSDPIDRGTWLMLLRYCIGQENSGRIKSCRDWKDRKWQQLVRVTKKEVEAVTDLWTWENDCLIIAYYPLEKEEEIKQMRELGRLSTPAKQAAAKANGSKGGRPTKNPTDNPTGNPTETQRETQPKTHEKPIEGKGREGKGKEGKGTEEAAPMALSGFSLENKQSFEIPTIVSLYPRQQRVAEACDEVRKHIAGGVKPEAIIAGTRAIAAVIPQMPSGHLNKFVPSALTFFRDRRWEDDPLTWLRNASGPNGATHTDTPQISGRKANTIRIPS